MSDELKPCPFCGGEARHANGWTTCSNFSCFVSDNGVKADKWNTRADHIPDDSKMMWISVDDRLPEPELELGGTEFSIDVLTWDGEDVGMDSVIYPHGVYGGSTEPKFRSEWKKEVDAPITHWMPLPRPPNITES